MKKTKYQKVWSKSGGSRHRMVYTDDQGKRYIKTVMMNPDRITCADRFVQINENNRVL